MLTLGLLHFQLHFTFSATLFLSFKVRACCDSAVDFTGKKVVFVLVIFNIEVARNFYVTEQRISIPWGLSISRVRVLAELESSLRRATVADGCLRMNCISARNQTFASYLSLKLSVLPLHADLP